MHVEVHHVSVYQVELTWWHCPTSLSFSAPTALGRNALLVQQFLRRCSDLSSGRSSPSLYQPDSSTYPGSLIVESALLLRQIQARIGLLRLLLTKHCWEWCLASCIPAIAATSKVTEADVGAIWCYRMPLLTWPRPRASMRMGS